MCVCNVKSCFPLMLDSLLDFSKSVFIRSTTIKSFLFLNKNQSKDKKTEQNDRKGNNNTKEDPHEQLTALSCSFTKPILRYLSLYSSVTHPAEADCTFLIYCFFEHIHTNKIVLVTNPTKCQKRDNITLHTYEVVISLNYLV